MFPPFDLAIFSTKSGFFTSIESSALNLYIYPEKSSSSQKKWRN